MAVSANANEECYMDRKKLSKAISNRGSTRPRMQHQRGIKGDKVACLHRTSVWEPRQSLSSACSRSNASPLPFLYWSGPLLSLTFSAYFGISAICRQVFVPLWRASITPSPSLNGASEKREGKRCVFYILESQQSSFLLSFITTPRAEKGARQHKPEINPAKRSALLSFLSAPVSVPIFNSCCRYSCASLLSLHPALLSISVETLFWHTAYKKWD